MPAGVCTWSRLLVTLTHMHCVGVCPCAETMFVYRLKELPVTVEHGRTFYIKVTEYDIQVI